MPSGNPSKANCVGFMATLCQFIIFKIETIGVFTFTKERENQVVGHLSKSHLSKSHLSKAHLSKSHLSKSHLPKSHLSKSHIRGVLAGST